LPVNYEENSDNPIITLPIEKQSRRRSNRTHKPPPLGIDPKLIELQLILQNAKEDQLRVITQLKYGIKI